ncbi:MAG: rRNA pseudouridine synthase [Caldilineaceae bacterium]|nr:rRNA pseudouridine synthase [Caldilineaceae bacterium]
MAEERLQKILAGAGVASRRASEALIVAGRVTVNGHVVTELGTKVDADVVQIAVDGKPVKPPKRQVYLKMHKPRGVISDIGGDMHGRQSVADLLPPEMRRLFPVGRLDLNSEGLILLTDDGELANKLTHPRYEHPKTYYVLVADRPPVSALEQLRNGVELPDGKTAPAEVRVVSALPQGIRLAPGPTSGVWLEIVLREGKKRQIRHMTAAVGFPTLRLIRWAIGPLLLGDLKVGESVPLIRREVAALRNALRAGGRPAVEPNVAPVRRRPGSAGKPPTRSARNQGNRSRPR